MPSVESQRQEGLGDQIRAAQLQAGIKHPHSTFRPHKLNERIRAAQLEAGTKQPASPRGGDPASPREAGGEAGGMAPEAFLGKWTDSYGNTVFVYSMDAFETRPMATLSRAPRPDVHLKLVLREDGWRCGGGLLDESRSSETQVCWVFPTGGVSVWTRTLEGQEGGQRLDLGPMELLQRHHGHLLPPQQQMQMWMPVGMVRIG
mmetsp:Transcript_58140/g.165265  ORF Transcript_58140/g.165265 Transcript_58140/m.165265 type:complete len:203 (-) Transcript_58140:128-736(-)